MRLAEHDEMIETLRFRAEDESLDKPQRMAQARPERPCHESVPDGSGLPFVVSSCFPSNCGMRLFAMVIDNPRRERVYGGGAVSRIRARFKVGAHGRRPIGLRKIVKRLPYSIENIKGSGGRVRAYSR